MKLARFPDFTLAQARKYAREKLADCRAEAAVAGEERTLGGLP